jgi:murein DD-endopeptidase MepM/ murein hydrolase activator NlpD
LITPAAISLLTLLSAATVRVQPGTAKPGDAVLITVQGADPQHEPQGRLGGFDLDFLPFAGGWQALIGLPVELEDGSLELSVTMVADAQELDVQGTLEIIPPEFRSSELKVSKKFTSPSKSQRAWSRRDQAAFDAAFGQERSERLFTGNFSWPRNDVVTAPFGDLRMFNGKKKSQHFGVDLNGDTGDEAFASNDGKVVMQRECFGSGNTVILFHGMGLYTAYFHLSRFDVKAGQKVKKGQRIGLIGKTGRVTGPHLHWGAKISGRWVDARSVLTLDFQ